MIIVDGSIAILLMLSAKNTNIKYNLIFPFFFGDTPKKGKVTGDVKKLLY